MKNLTITGYKLFDKKTNDFHIPTIFNSYEHIKKYINELVPSQYQSRMEIVEIHEKATGEEVQG